MEDLAPISQLALGGGVFTWRRLFPWPIITGLCLGEEPRLESSLAEGNAVRYAQKSDKRGSFSNATTVLYLSNLVAGARAPLEVQGSHPSPRYRSSEPQNDKSDS